MMWWGDGWMMGWAWVLGGIVVTGLVIGAVALAVMLARPRSGGPHGGSEPSSVGARRILDDRYARGEIDTAEYEERTRALQRP